MSEDKKDHEAGVPETQAARIDIDTMGSRRTGIAGAFERMLRRFRLVVPLIALAVLYSLGAFCMGLALVPAIYLFGWVASATAAWSAPLHCVAVAMAFSFGYFVYGFTLILVVPLANFLLPFRIRPARNIYYSSETVPWFFHNALTYLVRYTFLNFITPTPFNNLFYRLMGMKIGKGVQINSTNISDPGILELEDKVTIGGSATIICHYAAGGFLVIAPVIIRKGATVGIKATVMGGVEIGEGAKILPNSAVMPKTKIPAGEIWGGIPARPLPKSELSAN